MPKVVNHEQRRRELAEAVWRITARRGLESVTLRSVAAEAAVSMGAVQHYFSTKEEMVLFACRYMVELANAGAESQLEQSAEPEYPKGVIRSVLHQTLPLDEQQRIGSSVWLAFVARAAVDSDLMDFIREAWNGLHDVIAGQLVIAKEHGEIPAETDVDIEATVLATMTDGLTNHLLVGQYSIEMALAAVEHNLDRLFTRAPPMG